MALATLRNETSRCEARGFVCRNAGRASFDQVDTHEAVIVGREAMIAAEFVIGPKACGVRYLKMWNTRPR